MVPLFLGQSSYAIDKIECLLEVMKTELAMEVVFVGDRPSRDDAVQLRQFRAFQRRNASPARHTSLVGKFSHESPQNCKIADSPEPRAAVYPACAGIGSPAEGAALGILK